MVLIVPIWEGSEAAMLVLGRWRMLLSFNQTLTRVTCSTYWAFNLASQVTKAELLHIFKLVSKHHKITSLLLTKYKLLLVPNPQLARMPQRGWDLLLVSQLRRLGRWEKSGSFKEFEALKSGSFTHWPGTSVWELLSKYSDCQQDVYYMQNWHYITLRMQSQTKLPWSKFVLI